MTSEEYGQYIDDFELGADVMPGESLTEYIERRRREFDSKADGGVIGIEVKIADEMAKGGRVGLFSGGALKGLASLFKGGDKAADLAKQEEIFRKGPITKEFLETVDSKVINPFVRSRDMKGVGSYGLYDNFDDMPAGLKAAEIIKRFVNRKTGEINYDAAEFFIGRKLKGDETIDELIDIAIREPIGTGKGPLKDFEEYVLNPAKKADGGRVGLFMGGDPLTGQALQIYNSMKNYNFTDQEIADALSARGLYTAAGSGTGTETTAPNIIGSQLNQAGGSGGGGITELQETFRTEPGDPKNFRLSQLEGEADYFPPTTMMGKAKNFIQENLFKPQVRGTLGTRMANQPRIPIPSFASFLANYSSPFNMQSKNYNPLLEEQLNFAETQDGLIGRDPNSGLLKYGPESVLSGKNVVSLFGTNDYEKMLVDYITKMSANQKIKKTIKDAKIAQAEAELKALQEKTEAARAARYGKTDYGRGVGGQRSYSGDALGDKDLGFGIGATTGGPVSNRTGRGRTDYSKGGLATMFTRRR